MTDNGVYKQSVHEEGEEYVYLASPYSDIDPAVRHQRYKAVCRIAGRLMEGGIVVFCPIAHSHAVGDVLDVREAEHEFWMRQDIPFLARASKLVVAMLPGWKQSRGVSEEIYFAIRRGIPVEYLEVE